MMTIIKPIDVEDAVRLALSAHMTNIHCRPLPRLYNLPNILVTATGGSQDTDWNGADVYDTFTVNLTCRGTSEAQALNYLRTAIGVLKASQGGTLRKVTLNSQYSWGNDPERPDLAVCGATLLITANPETSTLN